MSIINHTASGVVGDDKVEIRVTLETRVDTLVPKFEFGLSDDNSCGFLEVIPLRDYVEEMSDLKEIDYMLSYAQDAAELWMLHNSDAYSNAMIDESIRNPWNK